MGASDTVQEGSWTWVTGESWSYTNWYGSNPDNSGNEDYLEIGASDGRWNDDNDGGSAGYVLETVHAPTNPHLADSDGDGVDDLSEINQGRNPNFVELTGWTEVGNGVWNRQSSDLTVFQSFNSTSHAFYLSPYDLLNKKITFEMKVSDPTDNDWIGFVVGYVDASNYHYFTWTRSEPSGGGDPPDGWKFQRVENGVTTVLAVDETDYTRGGNRMLKYKVTVHYTSGKTVIHLEGRNIGVCQRTDLGLRFGQFCFGQIRFLL